VRAALGLSRYAVDHNTVTPERTRSVTMRHNSRRDSGIPPTPGSSSNSSFGRPTARSQAEFLFPCHATFLPASRAVKA